MKNLKTTIKTAVLLAFTITLFSCGSDDDTIPTDIKYRLTNYSKDAIRSEFTYDSQGRLSTYISNGESVSLSYNTNGKLIQKGVETYDYNSQGKINKITVANTVTTIDKITNIIYNSQGKISRLEMSSKSVATGRKLTQHINLEYDSNNKLISITDYHPSFLGNTRYIKKTFTLDSNGNTIEVRREGSSNNIDFRLREVYTYTYDNKKNPYYDVLKYLGDDESISLIKIVPSIGSEINSTLDTQERVFFYSPNNQVARTHVSNSFTTYDTEIGYVYNDDDYPISAQLIGIKINNKGSSINLSASYNWNYEEN